MEVSVDTQNVTLALPKDLLKEARLRAVERGTSLSALLADHLRLALKDDAGYEAARRRMQQRMRRGLDLGTRGEIRIARSDLYER